MILEIPKLSPEDRKQFKRIFGEMSNCFDEKINEIKNRSFWKRFWDSKSVDLLYYITIKETVDTLSNLFNEKVSKVEFHEN